MAHPELSLPIRPLQERFLEVAAEICKQEVRVIKPWAGNRLIYNWRPITQEPFAVPIAIERLKLTRDPFTTDKYEVVAGEFKILGDDEMNLVVDRNQKKFDDDEWNRFIFNKFAGSFLNHSHEICEIEIDHRLGVEAPGTSSSILSPQSADPGFKMTDKRRII